MSATISPANKDSVTERVAALLRQKIIQGEFSPGQRLSEQHLSAALGISRNSLREVFRVLNQEALLRHAPNRGVFVTQPDIASIIDIYRVRRMLECHALAHASPGHPAMERMQQALRQAQAACESQDWKGVGTANMAFHNAVVDLADSARLQRLYEQVSAELRLAFGVLQDPQYLHAPFVQKNAHILALLQAGNCEQAELAMQEYLTHSERVVLAGFARGI